MAALNDILRPLSAQRATLLPLVGKPCPDIHLTLRKMAASLQTIRSVALVTSGIVYCSSILARDRRTYIACSPRFLRPALCCSSRTTAPCSKARRY
nr:CSS motif domain associated with EAL [Klebsiella pneumoniae]